MCCCLFLCVHVCVCGSRPSYKPPPTPPIGFSSRFSSRGSSVTVKLHPKQTSHYLCFTLDSRYLLSFVFSLSPLTYAGLAWHVGVRLLCNCDDEDGCLAETDTATWICTLTISSNTGTHRTCSLLLAPLFFLSVLQRGPLLWLVKCNLLLLVRTVTATYFVFKFELSHWLEQLFHLLKLEPLIWNSLLKVSVSYSGTKETPVFLPLTPPPKRYD